MTTSVEDLMRAYVSKYPQEVREVVETFAAGPTRLSGAHKISPMSEAGVRAIALRQGVDAEALISAVIDYAEIEALAEQSLRGPNGRS